MGPLDASNVAMILIKKVVSYQKKVNASFGGEKLRNNESSGECVRSLIGTKWRIKYLKINNKDYGREGPSDES